MQNFEAFIIHSDLKFHHAPEIHVTSYKKQEATKLIVTKKKKVKRVYSQSYRFLWSVNETNDGWQ